MQKFLTMFKLYSVQVLLVIASLNTVIATIDGVPWWAVLGVNVAGVIAHQIARGAPQPQVTAQLSRM